MKRIVVSILIGTGCSLAAFTFLQLIENKFKKFHSKKPLYNGEVKLKIGDVADDKRAVITTLNQVKKRIDFIPGFSAKQLDKNIFLISIKRVNDTVRMKRLLGESIELKFLETFLIPELADSLNAVENELTRRRKKIDGLSDSSDKYDFLLEEIDVEIKKRNGTCRLNQLISFFPGFQEPSGHVRYPAGLGTVKTRDTVYLNKLLNDREIKNKFPPELLFAYEIQTDNTNARDSVLIFYAIRATDPKHYLLPTGDNIKDCQVSIEPSTRAPVIMFEFDVDGSNYWYTMTQKNKGRPIAILMDNVVLTAPVVEEAIGGGQSRIIGSFTYDEARYLTSMIRTGRLALPVQLIESKFESVQKSYRTVWIMALIFLISSLVAYGISFLIKRVSNP